MRKSFNLFLPNEDVPCGSRVISLSSPVCRQTAFTGGKASSLAFMTQNLEDICAGHSGKALFILITKNLISDNTDIKVQGQNQCGVLGTTILLLALVG